MNIFILDQNPRIAAQYHNDKHVCKMSIEYAQILSTVHHLVTPADSPTLKGLYKATHQHHPAVRWVLAHPEHYVFVYALMTHTWDEYTHRYGKVHASSRLRNALRNPPAHLVATGPLSAPPLCMPEHFHRHDIVDPWKRAIASYRDYYLYDKLALASWTKRDRPFWYLLKDEAEPVDPEPRPTEYPTTTREDGRIERMCEHGIGHPIAHTSGTMPDWGWIHGCDGCCRSYTTTTAQE